jgi:tRNA dimethylallyltransferase
VWQKSAIKDSMTHAITLFGPTASGKTALAIRLAQAVNGVIINADSRQLFKHMPLLTACPTAEEYSLAPHRLYEILAPDAPCSAGDYLALARAAAADVVAAGQCPIFVGGSGLYMDVLLHGLSPVPDIPPPVVEGWKKKLATKGASALYDELEQADRAWAETFPPTDSQRIVRGLSVLSHTGQPLSSWLQLPKEGALPYNFINLGLAPPREEVKARIGTRFQALVKQGLREEASALKARGYSPELSALKSLGVQELWAHEAGDLPWEEAEERFLTLHRRYAKRQMTWLNNTYPAARLFPTADAAPVLTFVQERLP